MSEILDSVKKLVSLAQERGSIRTVLGLMPAGRYHAVVGMPEWAAQLRSQFEDNGDSRSKPVGIADAVAVASATSDPIVFDADIIALAIAEAELETVAVGDIEELEEEIEMLRKNRLEVEQHCVELRTRLEELMDPAYRAAIYQEGYNAGVLACTPTAPDRE